MKAKEPGVSQVERQNKLDDGQVGDAIIMGYILYFEVVLCGVETEGIPANTVTADISAKTGLRETAGEALEMVSEADTPSQDGVYLIRDSRSRGRGALRVSSLVSLNMVRN
ncbi:hypothetical protein [Paenibacillus sp. P32E]|uniref:hypothetical protein n=1 Tax=Paenibacillus sp. P32E TaxID=1349434 RepID=UPI0015BDD324|nr:hypothetical protein [Paenibacillus sp. P32E]